MIAVFSAVAAASPTWLGSEEIMSDFERDKAEAMA